MIKRDKYFGTHLKKMIDGKLSHRRRRENMSREKCQIWQKEEIHRRARQMAEDRHKEALREMARERQDAQSEMAMRRLEEKVAAGEEVDGTKKKKERPKEEEKSESEDGGVHYHYHYHGDGDYIAPPANQTVINVAATTSLQVGNKNIANVAKNAGPEGGIESGIDPDGFDPDDLDRDSEVYLKTQEGEIVGLVTEPAEKDLMGPNDGRQGNVAPRQQSSPEGLQRLKSDQPVLNQSEHDR